MLQSGNSNVKTAENLDSSAKSKQSSVQERKHQDFHISTEDRTKNCRLELILCQTYIDDVLLLCNFHEFETSSDNPSCGCLRDYITSCQARPYTFHHTMMIITQYKYHYPERESSPLPCAFQRKPLIDAIINATLCLK